MPKVRFVCLLFLLLFSSLLSLTIPEFEQEVITFTNQARAEYGLKPLIYDKGLADVARSHSFNMYSQNFYAHEDLQGLKCTDRQEKYYPELMNLGIGENLAKNYIPNRVFSSRELVEGWMNSPGHRANILEPDYTHIGVGVTVKDETLLATQNFAVGMVRLEQALPLTSTADSMILSFEYMSSKPRQSFAAWIVYPDPNVKFDMKDGTYYLGGQPQKLSWRDDKHFSVTIPFAAGKGDYFLTFGWDNSYYEMSFRITAR